MVSMHCFTDCSLMTKLSGKIEANWYTSKKPNVILRLLAFCLDYIQPKKNLYSLGILKQFKIDVLLSSLVILMWGGPVKLL
ncbi:MAG: hypothetical protein Ct9H300mP4_02340 [Gammaproteobacteria bacterium]|nr:MAG: hypothetical protein Ct9H300mP4_02340 [Gammaproteobacteria bacterium]